MKKQKVYIPRDGLTEYNQAVIRRAQLLEQLEKFEAFQIDLHCDSILLSLQLGSLDSLQESIQETIYSLNKEFRQAERIIINSR